MVLKFNFFFCSRPSLHLPSLFISHPSGWDPAGSIKDRSMTRFLFGVGFIAPFRFLFGVGSLSSELNR